MALAAAVVGPGGAEWAACGLPPPPQPARRATANTVVPALLRMRTYVSQSASRTGAPERTQASRALREAVRAGGRRQPDRPADPCQRGPTASTPTAADPSSGRTTTGTRRT